MTYRILVVDDEPGIRAALRQTLEFEKHDVRVASSGGEALTIYPDYRPHLVLLDVKMAGLDGLDTLSRLCDIDPAAVVIMISGHGTITTAIDATRRGAFDFMEKPLDTNRTVVTVRKAIEWGILTGAYARLQQESAGRYAMVGDSPALQSVREIITRVAPTPARVLISGENGTGKELVARAIHDGSPRRAMPFIEVNCAAIPAELIESELFGHMKGSFTGAGTDREGKFELADEGTLFLDEVGDMSLPAQAKVLRALQEGVITRIGGAKSIQVDVRVIAATNKNLDAEIATGRFRQDLFYRLNVVPINVPPLRERRDDIPALVQHFVLQLKAARGSAGKQFDTPAITQLQHRPWPGNVRELRNAVERLLILTAGKSVTGSDVIRLLGEEGRVPEEYEMIAPEGGRYGDFRDATDRKFLQAALDEHGYNVTQTARALGMARPALVRKIEHLKLGRKAP